MILLEESKILLDTDLKIIVEPSKLLFCWNLINNGQLRKNFLYSNNWYDHST